MQYSVLESRIEYNKRKIEQLKKKDIPVVAGKVTGSSREFPYTERRFGVQMEEPVENGSTGNI